MASKKFELDSGLPWVLVRKAGNGYIVESDKMHPLVFSHQQHKVDVDALAKVAMSVLVQLSPTELKDPNRWQVRLADQEEQFGV